MAKKGQSFKKYSPEFRQKVVNEYLSDPTCTLASICRKYNISSSESLTHWVNCYNKEGVTGLQEKRGTVTKSTSPFKGRPRKYFSSLSEKERYFRQREEFEKRKALDKEQKRIESNRI